MLLEIGSDEIKKLRDNLVSQGPRGFHSKVLKKYKMGVYSGPYSQKSNTPRAASTDFSMGLTGPPHRGVQGSDGGGVRVI